MAVAARATAAPDAKFWPAVGLLTVTTGAVFPPPVVAIVNATAVEVVLNAGLPLSTAVAVTEWLPAVSPVAVKA